MGGRPLAVSDAGAIPPQDRGAVRLIMALGVMGAVGSRFAPDAYVAPAAAAHAIELARSVSDATLARALAPLATSVTAVASPLVVEPGQTVQVSAAVHDGELALPLPVDWSATGGVVAGGTFVPAARNETATLLARVPDSRVRANVEVTVEVPSRLVAERPPPAVLADQTTAFTFAVVNALGRVVQADSGRAVTVRLVPPSGPVVVARPLDRAGLVTFDYRPTLLGRYRLEASARGLAPATARLTVVPGSLGSLSILSSATSLGTGGRLSLAATVLPAAGVGPVPEAVPVTMTAVLDPPTAGPVPLGAWRGSAPTALTSLPVTLANLGPLTGPGTLVVNLTSPGGAFLPARIDIPIAGSGRLRLSPVERTLTAGSGLLLTASADAPATLRVPLSLAITAPDGGPLAPMRQMLDHGRAQFLLTPNAVGTYRLEVSGPGLSGASASVTVRPSPPDRLEALLATPFPAPGTALSLRLWALDAHQNPVAGPALDVRWRYIGRRDAPWHRATATSGATLALPKPPPGTDCSVDVRLAAPALHLRSERILPCTITPAPADIVSGTGVFLSYWVARDAPPDRIVAQAVREGVHTLYVEVAIPGTGFWGEPGLDRLLAPAHAAGLAVVAWVPADLGNPARDTAAARAALAYRTPLGQRVDGLSADFEGRLAASVIGPYLRAVRAAAGPRRVVCAVADPPTNLAIPYALMGRYADVLMPMDYWQTTESPTTFADAFRAVSTSVALVRSEAPDRGVVPVLQGYDPFSLGGTGVYNPGPLAENGALAGALSAGAQGAAFFQWGTLTDAEWTMIAKAGRAPF